MNMRVTRSKSKITETVPIHNFAGPVDYSTAFLTSFQKQMNYEYKPATMTANQGFNIDFNKGKVETT